MFRHGIDRNIVHFLVAIFKKKTWVATKSSILSQNICLRLNVKQWQWLWCCRCDRLFWCLLLIATPKDCNIFSQLELHSYESSPNYITVYQFYIAIFPYFHFLVQREDNVSTVLQYDCAKNSIDFANEYTLFIEARSV